MSALRGPVMGAVFASVLALGWTYRAPVVVFMTAQNVAFEAGSVTAEVFGRKLRNCEVVKGSVIGWYERGGVWFEIEDFEFLQDRTPDSTRPTGRQSFGVWRWGGIHPDATAVRMTMEHLCGDTLRVTTNGPFRLPR